MCFVDDNGNRVTQYEAASFIFARSSSVKIFHLSLFGSQAIFFRLHQRSCISADAMARVAIRLLGCKPLFRSTLMAGSVAAIGSASLSNAKINTCRNFRHL